LEAVPHEFEALTVLLVLLPGFVSARIAQSLCLKPKQSDIDKVLESLLYSFLVYVIFVVSFGKALPVKINVQAAKEMTSYSIAIQKWPLAGLAGISIGLGLLVGVNGTKDISGSFLRRLGVSQRTTRNSVWNDVFHERGGAVQVGLADGRMVMGWVQHYSDDSDDSSVFLEKAAWVDPEQHTQTQIVGDGILLTKESKIEFIEFLDWPSPQDPNESVIQPPL
jgi:Family of unknown function (DUF6338)